MSRLAKYYDTRVASVDRNDFLKQVGHTERGKSITDEQFECMVAEIYGLLKLGPDDDVLDLCCGNGLITHQLAKKARSAVGIDFSGALIEIAKQNHHADNVRYHVLNALDLERLTDLETGRFTKVLMHGALQHFMDGDFELLIRGMLGVSVENPIILIGFVPEKEKRRVFYNTPRRKFDDIVRRATGRDIMGTWWEKTFISQTCRNLGLRCTFHDIDQSLDASRYRFDVKIF